MSEKAQAYLWAFLSALLNGSFAALSKVPSTAPVDPVVFTFYNSIGVLLSSVAVIPFLGYLHGSFDESSIYHAGSDHFTFSWLGVAAGTLYILAALFSFAAVKLVGLGVGQGVWGGTAIVVSFLWGVLALGNTVDSISMAILSLMTLLAGIAGIAQHDALARLLVPMPRRRNSEKLLLAVNGVSEDHNEHGYENGSNNGGTFVAGLICAVAVGLSDGSILVPMSFVSAELEGLVFLPSFGIGGFVAAAIVLVGQSCGLVAGTRRVDADADADEGKGARLWRWPKWNASTELVPGILSGVIWNGGNLCSIYAIHGIGYATAYPILQCALFFGGLWGIYGFREVTETKSIAFFFGAGGVLCNGAILLSLNTNPPADSVKADI